MKDEMHLLFNEIKFKLRINFHGLAFAHYKSTVYMRYGIFHTEG